MKGNVSATRRNFLHGAALALAGVFGGVFASGGDRGLSPLLVPPVRGGETQLKLYGCHWHLYSQGRKKGEQPLRGDQQAMYGELLDGPEGNKVGEFYSSGQHLRFPFGPSPYAAANMEVHSFNLVGGTLVGMGTARPGRDVESVYAVIGGTGRYAGARGSYTALQRPVERGGDGTAEFAFTLSL